MGMLKAIHDSGWRGVLMHFRGCSGEQNRLDRSYHSGETGDLEFMVDLLRARHPNTPIAAVGFSLGGNVLLKWLGEQGPASVLCAATAISVPFLLGDCADRLERGFSRFYQWWLIRTMRLKVAAKFGGRPAAPIDLTQLDRLTTFRRFDDQVTAPLHGFADVTDYYRRSSSYGFLSDVQVPTLILHARDDPFMTEKVIPDTGQTAPSIRLEVYEQGGHVGFVDGPWPWKARYWLEERVPRFIAEHIAPKTP
jgi:predicted alpha/beta-fold hydrolase